MVKNGILHCAYHGLGFDGAGACRHNPHGAVLAGAAVRAYPLRERAGAIWIWMGEGPSDDASLPDLSSLEEALPTARSHGYLHSRGGYLLFCDNLLDLSHADYLHADTLGGGTLTRTRARIEKRDRGLTSIWTALGDAAQPMMDQFLPEQGKPADIEVTVDWTAPGTLRLTNRIKPTNGAEEDMIEVDNYHFVTPETATTTHYFFAATRNFRIDDAALNAQIASVRHRVFSTEDNPIIEAQQELLGDDDLMEVKPLLLPIDSGGVQARRILDRMIAAETGQQE
jgi:vanillate O-demethylase monooxygenase subunit